MCTMKFRRTLIISTLFVLTTAHVAAQDTVTMDLKACMRYAVEHSTKVRIQQSNNRDAQIDRRDAILAAFTPEVSAGTNAYYNFGRSIDPETNTYSLVTSFHNGYSVSAGMVLFNGFQAVNNLKITKTAQMMGLTQEQQIEDQICLATLEAYCNVLYYTELEKALVAQVATAEKSVQLSLSIPIFDRLSAYSNIAKKKNAYDRTVADYEQALQTVEAEVRRAVADRDGTADALRQAETRAALQQEAFALNTKRFEQGLISSIEYQTASNTYLNALAEHLNAQLQYFIKCSVVNYYGGTPYIEQ